MPEPLTARQSEILSFVREFVGERGFPPSHADIGERFGFGRTASRDHLLALQRKGYLDITSDARGIRLLGGQRRPASELPLLGRIAAGSPLIAESNVESWLTVDPGLFRPRADFLLRVAGNSMNAADILNGDLVGIHAQEDAESGQIIAAVLLDPKTGDDLITLKRYSRSGSKILLKPHSTDTRFKPMEIDLSTLCEGGDPPAGFRIAGLYAGHLRASR